MAKDKISRKIESAISDGIFPGAVLLCAVNQKIIFHQPYGMADIFEKRSMKTQTCFDLASLTKPLATTLAVSRLLARRQIFLNQKIGSILKEFQISPKKEITIDMLLRHRSGLPAYREYYKKIIEENNPPQGRLRRLLVNETLENMPNECQLYSDLGFMILSWIIETIACQRLDQFVQKQIYAPIGIDNLFFMPRHQDIQKISTQNYRFAATQQCPWRKKILIGEVDDDNAWAVGGVEGHAGLFGDAESIFKICCEILNAMQNKPTKILVPEIIQTLVEKKDLSDMVAGFDTPSKKKSSSGRYFSKSSIGHLGFTGTSFWIDPDVSLIVIFLTNRVHPSRSNEGIKKFRPQLHDLIYEELI